jgi:hypothetical protein
MKGMDRIKRGSGFRALLDYLLENKNGPAPGRMIGGTMSGTTPRQLAHEFAVSRQLRPDIKKPVWHNSLRLPVGDDVSDDKWMEIAKDYMKQIGFDIEQTQFCCWKHDDEAALHIAASRIGLDGKIYLGRNENLISTRVIQQLEKDYDLRVTKGPELTPEGKVKLTEKRAPTKNELEKALRTGQRPAKMVIQDSIDQILTSGPLTAPDFISTLEAHGIIAKPNIASTGKFSGFSFSLTGHTNKTGQPIWYKGSSLGQSYKADPLLQRGLLYDPIRDMPILTGRHPQPAPDYSGEPKIRRRNGGREYSLLIFMKFEPGSAGGQLYSWQSGAPAFLDHGNEILCAGRATDAKIRGMLDLAREKGWSRIELTGPLEFQMAAAMEAARRGISISGDNKEIQEIWREYDRTTAERTRKPQPRSHRLNTIGPSTSPGCVLRGLHELDLVPLGTGPELLLQGDARDGLGIDEQNAGNSGLRREDVIDGIENRTGSATAATPEATDTAGNRASETGNSGAATRNPGDQNSNRDLSQPDPTSCRSEGTGDHPSPSAEPRGHQEGSAGRDPEDRPRGIGGGIAALKKTDRRFVQTDRRPTEEEKPVRVNPEAEPPRMRYPSPGG